MSVVYVEVKNTGNVYSGWTDVEITQSLDDASSSFSMNTADIGIDIQTGDLVSIRTDKTLLFTGYVDSANESYTANSHDIQISGRSKTKDLIDCTAPPLEWGATKASVILNQLTSVYNVKTVLAIPDVIVPYFSVQKDSPETIIDAIHRLATQLKAIVTDDANGNLVLTQAGTALSNNFLLNRLNDTRSNILSGSYNNDESGRYSKISIRSQIRGTDTNFGTQAQRILASAKDDKNISRKRELVLDSSEPLSQTQAQDLVNWQIAYNSGKSIGMQYEVPGWSGASGVWQLNSQVRVTDDFFGIDNTYLITELNFSKSGNGTITKITLHPVAAYIPSPKVEKLPTKGKRKGKKGKKGTDTVPFAEYEANDQ